MGHMGFRQGSWKGFLKELTFQLRPEGGEGGVRRAKSWENIGGAKTSRQ